MSLDVSLRTGPTEHHCHECNGTGVIKEYEYLFEANITHNLIIMASEAGIYKHLWRPEELGITKAKELIEPLRHGLELMRSDRARFEAFDSPNGWGLYVNFLPWIEKYLKACEEYPDATIRVSR